MPDRPVLFVDIDGVISLWGFDSDDRPAGAFHNIDGVIHFLSSDAGKHLLGLRERFELVWCSGWEEKANEHLPRVLALPGALPFLSFERNPGRGHGHWKLAAIDAYAGPRRALAWIDDAHDEACHAWAARRAAPTLLVATTPAIGLSAAHVEQLNAWAETAARGTSRDGRLARLARFARRVRPARFARFARRVRPVRLARLARFARRVRPARLAWPERLERLERRALPGGLTLLVAADRRARRRGLARLGALPAGHGLLLERCRSVHTLGMRFALDLVWLDGDGAPVRLDRAVAPGRLRTCLRARAVVESAAGDGERFAAALAAR